MNAKHFDIGTIQAFLDGELSHDRIAEVSSHIAACDDCALMLSVAEDESAIVFPALEREFNSLVPTQRLWNKINVSIATERDNAPFWQKAWSFLSVAVLNPSIAVAASLLIVFALVATLWMNRTPVINEVAENVPVKVTSSVATISVSQNDPKNGDIVSDPLRNTSTVERASYRSEPRRQAITPTVIKAVATESNEGLPGEDSYLKTIATLSKTVDSTKDNMMRPSERVAYERNMAVVNDSITKMREQVKKNPKNESAKQVLYSSYQNKIDLLSSVSRKEELMASLSMR